MVKFRYCPVCKRPTFADGDSERRCSCGWHEKSRLTLPKPGNESLLVPARRPSVARLSNPVSDHNPMLIKPKE